MILEAMPRRKDPLLKLCPVCSAVFITTNSLRKLCSDRCAKEADKAAKRAWFAKKYSDPKFKKDELRRYADRREKEEWREANARHQSNFRRRSKNA